MNIFSAYKVPFKVTVTPGGMHMMVDADNKQMAQVKDCETAHAICDELNTVCNASTRRQHERDMFRV